MAKKVTQPIVSNGKQVVLAALNLKYTGGTGRFSSLQVVLNN